MLQDPFPPPGPDCGEPDSSPLLPAAGEDEPVQQGLYLCTPPEQLALAGFAQNGEADTMTPGPLTWTIPCPGTRAASPANAALPHGASDNDTHAGGPGLEP